MAWRENRLGWVAPEPVSSPFDARGIRGLSHRMPEGEGHHHVARILVIILIIFLLGGFSGRFGGYGYGYGHGGVGIIGIILIVLVVLLLMGRI